MIYIYILIKDYDELYLFCKKRPVSTEDAADLKSLSVVLFNSVEDF